MADAITSLAVGPELSYMNDKMEAGTKRLLSLSIPEYATLGVPNGVGNSDGYYIDMEANVRLHTFDAVNIEQSTINRIWDALLI